MKADTFKLARDMVQGKWLVANPDRLLPVARAFLSRAPLEIEVQASSLSEVTDPSAKGSSSKKVAVVPIHGTMTKYETCESYGATTLAAGIRRAADDKDVAGIVLDIDSGGGSSSAVPPFLEAIGYARGKGKPVLAHVDMCGSAAYWVASQCDAIYMDNTMSEVGSVGCYYVMYDTSAADPQTGIREITIYSRKSADKNLAYRKALEGDFEPAMDELDEFVQHFQDAVVAGRPGISKDAEGVLSGRTFGSADAIRLGMADAVKTLDETIEVVFALAEIS